MNYSTRGKITLIVLFGLAFWLAGANLLTLYAAMNKSKAITEAHKIWGDTSHVDNGISWGETFDTYQIGYMVSGCGSPSPFFHVVAQGVGSWDAAFETLPANKGISAKISGTVDFHETTLAPVPVPTPGPLVGTVEPPGAMVSQDQVPGNLVAAQLVIDGKLYGGAAQINGTPWTIDLPVDSKTLSNGQHTVCTKLMHQDGSSTFSTPGMFLVANP